MIAAAVSQIQGLVAVRGVFALPGEGVPLFLRSFLLRHSFQFQPFQFDPSRQRASHLFGFGDAVPLFDCLDRTLHRGIDYKVEQYSPRH